MNKIKTKEGKETEVTADGSLGLLALGYRGLIAWRNKRAEEKKENPKSQCSHKQPKS